MPPELVPAKVTPPLAVPAELEPAVPALPLPVLVCGFCEPVPPQPEASASETATTAAAGPKNLTMLSAAILMRVGRGGKRQYSAVAAEAGRDSSW